MIFCTCATYRFSPYIDLRHCSTCNQFYQTSLVYQVTKVKVCTRPTEDFEAYIIHSLGDHCTTYPGKLLNYYKFLSLKIHMGTTYYSLGRKLHQRTFFIALRRRSIGLVQLHSTVADFPPRPDQMLWARTSTTPAALKWSTPNGVCHVSVSLWPCYDVFALTPKIKKLPFLLHFR